MFESLFQFFIFIITKVVNNKNTLFNSLRSWLDVGRRQSLSGGGGGGRGGKKGGRENDQKRNNGNGEETSYFLTAFASHFRIALGIA